MTDLLGAASLVAISAAIFGPLASWYAVRRDRRPIPWLILGALLGPIALGLLAFAPPGRCPACDSVVRGWPAVCATCGWPLSGRVPVIGSIGTRGRRIVEPDPPTTATPPAVREPAATSAAPAGSTRTSSPGEPIPLPVGRTARYTSRPVGMATGRPPGSTWAPAQPASVQSEVLATGVYFGGTAALTVGMRYALVREDDRLRLMGPLDTDPKAIALDTPLASLIATAIEERLIISNGTQRGFALALGSIAGTTSAALESTLSEYAAAASMRQASG